MSRHRRGVSSTGPIRMVSELPRWKRCLDLAVLVLAFPLAAPLMLFIAIAIKVVSPGPVFFRQERVGLNGCRFVCLKFRTMHFNAPTDGHQEYLKDLIRSGKPMTKMDQMGDQRLIRGARWLRSAGFDELPQLINVLWGEMSWVGPRPGTLSEYDNYTDEHKCRLQTLPGLTGLWQVSGKNNTTFEDMIRLDVHYARNKTIWMDLSIMAKTPMVLLSQCCQAVDQTKSKKKELEKKTERQKRAISLPVSF